MTAIQPAYGRRIAILLVCVFVVGPALFVGYRAVQTLPVLTIVERERDAWQRPADILQWLNVKEGSVVVDLGCGAGYFALKLSLALQQRPAKDDDAHAEVDHQSGHVDQCRDERRRGGGRIEPQPPQRER